MKLVLTIVGTLILAIGSASAIDEKNFGWKYGINTNEVEEDIFSCMTVLDFSNVTDISDCIDQDATPVKKLLMDLCPSINEDGCAENIHWGVANHEGYSCCSVVNYMTDEDKETFPDRDGPYYKIVHDIMAR